MNIKYKVCIIGHYGGKKEFFDGQTIKTKTLTEAIIHKFGGENVYTFDTYGRFKSLIKLFLCLPYMLKRSENILIMPAHNGIKVLSRLLPFWNKLFKRKLHYSVIGGWLPGFLKINKNVKKNLLTFDYIYVETTKMKNDLELQGFNNVCIVPNFKKLRIANINSCDYSFDKSLKICTLSRVMKQKGIEDIVNAVKEINCMSKRTVFLLDIFGKIDDGEKSWFENLRSSFTSEIKYLGIVRYDETTEVLKNYYALVFPTKFFTEGIPGTIIDAYSAGTPVIASRWENYKDSIIDGKTGLTYEFDNYGELLKLLNRVKDNPKELNEMRKNCINYAIEFEPSRVINKIRID